MQPIRHILWLSVAAFALSASGCGGGGGSTETPAGVPTPPPTGSGSWTVRIAWDASQTTGVYGYRLYAGTSSSNLSSASGLITDTSADVPITSAGTYYFAVSAVDVNNIESAPSSPVSIDVR